MIQPEELDRTLAFIASFVKQRGYAPSVREIRAGLGLKSPAMAQVRLDKLKAQGRVTWEFGLTRTLRITEPPDA